MEEYARTFSIDILNLQEFHITDNTFEFSPYLNANYNIIINNSETRYGTACLVSFSLRYDIVRMDTNGQITGFNLPDIEFTVAHVYFPCGQKLSIKDLRQAHSGHVIHELLIYIRSSGVMLGDFNCDCSNFQSFKLSASLKTRRQTEHDNVISQLKHNTLNRIPVQT